MNKKEVFRATPGRAKVPTPRREHPVDGDNFAHYSLGRLFADRIALRVERGLEGPAAILRVAADLGLDVAKARRAVRFQEAGDRIAGNVGEWARQAIMAGGRHLLPMLVKKIGNTHSDCQRFCMARDARGQHSFARLPAGVESPFDTLGHGVVLSRLARSAGALDRVAEGLAATPAREWPTDAKLGLMTDHLGQVRKSCSMLRALLGGPDARAHVGTVLAGSSRSRWQCRPSASPTIFQPDRTLGFVAAARGVAAKNVRDLPRLLRESPMTDVEHDSLLARLQLLDLAARKLADVVRKHTVPRPPRSSAMRSGPLGRASAITVSRENGVHVEEATEDPSSSGGTYVVVFLLDADATVTVGKLGTFAFPAGFYAYIGFAFGPGGVRARTARHRTRDIARKKWNIDHMKSPLQAVEVWWTNDPIKRECSWSAALAATPGFSCPAVGFGSHDCRVNRTDGFGSPVGQLCEAHLYHSLEPPDVYDFASRLSRLVPGHATAYRHRLGHDQQD